MKISEPVCSQGTGVSAVLILIFLAASSACALVDENLPADSWTYSLVRELDLRGYRLLEFGHARPVSVRGIAARLQSIRGDVEAGRLHPPNGDLWLLEALEREFREEIRWLESANLVGAGIWGDVRFVRDRGGDGAWHGQGIGEAALRVGSNTTLYHRSWLDTRAEDDSSILSHPWRDDFSAVTDAAYVLRRSEHWRILLGRERMDWGPGYHGGLVLSGIAPPLDMVKAELRVSRFRGTAFTAVLDDYEGPYSSDGSVRAARYLSGHRLAWRPGPSLEISASELILYGGEDRLPEIRYLVPLFFYYGEQWNAGTDDNPFWAFDVSWYPRPGARVYGEVLIDDFQYEADAEPNEVGFVVGGEVAGPLRLRGSVFGLEYARINRWTYGQNKPWNRYLNHGVCIGHPLGPDADGLWARFQHPVAGSARLSVELGRVRRGEGRIDEERSTVVPFDDRFPSGVVETRTALALALEIFPWANRWLFGEVEWARSRNFQHEQGRDRDEWTAVLRCRVGLERLRAVD